MKESDLAKFFIDYLSCYDLYFEIPMLNVDIVAKHGNVLMAFEVKRSLNFRVIEQAAHNYHWFNYSYICVPWARNMHFAKEVCSIFGIGILTIHVSGNMAWGDVNEYLKPRLNRSAHSLKKSIKLPEYCKRSIAGASGNAGTTITPFKITVENIIEYVKKNPDPTIKEVFDNVETHYSSFSSAKSSLYQWIYRGIIKDFYFENGIVKLKNGRLD